MALKKWPPLMDPSTFRNISPGDHAYLYPWAGRSLLFSHPGLKVFLHFLSGQTWFKLSSVVTVAKVATNHHFTPETSSFNRQEIKKIIFPSTPSTYTTKLSPMCFRILLDLFVPAVGCSQLSSGKSKFPTRQLKIFEINKQTRHFHNHYSDQISN